MEGDTEDGYLVPFRRAARGRWSVKVEVVGGLDRLSTVEHAIAQRRAAAREQARGGGPPYDQVWCVFDHDDDPRVGNALDLALANDVHVGFSNPCIELWFIWHYEDRAAWTSGADAQRRAAELLGCRKILTKEASQDLSERYEGARRRAVAMEAKHLGDGSPPFSNPSSTVHGLIDVLRGARSPDGR